MSLSFLFLQDCKSGASFLLQPLDVSLLLLQATAEQIRLAQMISDHNDADFEEKVKQVSRCTSSCPTSAFLCSFSWSFENG